eukprot:709250_1
MSQWSELLQVKASVYKLDEISRGWMEYGIGGQLTMVQTGSDTNDTHIMYIRTGDTTIWWKLINGRIKPKGERAWVLKACHVNDNVNKQEILAIRFSDQQSAQLFANKFKQVFDPPEAMMSANSTSHRMAHTKRTPSVHELQQVAADIACHNNNPTGVFSTLRSVAKKLLKDDTRYRILDTANPKVRQRLIDYVGVLDFLMLMGFEADAMGMKLICHEKPSCELIRNVIRVLDSYSTAFRIPLTNSPNTKNDYHQK